MVQHNTPRAFHVMTKPIGPICNLDCEYCFYLDKEKLYPETRSFRMDDEVLENYVKQYIEAQEVNEVTFAWQGGEPTLMGVDFFRQAIRYQQKYRRPGMQIQNSFQTNATLLDDEWGEFFKRNKFLIGVSIDGPPEIHDKYRYDKRGRPSSEQVIRGLRILQKHKVDYNILCVVNKHNAEYPKEVYNYFKELGAEFMQFIPAVEHFDGKNVSPRSVTARQYGKFLSAIFDEWVVNDIGRIFVQIFDVALEAWLGYNPSLCVFNETCGDALAIEHNGDLYSCDHYVTPDYHVGNIAENTIQEMVDSTFQRKFGTDKRDTLPEYCRSCEVKFVCNGGCPKNRFIKTPTGEDGLNYLCAGYKHFFNHIDEPMKMMAAALQAGRPANSIIPVLRQRQQEKVQANAPIASQTSQKVGRNSPCPCGSGRKYKQCCLNKK
ncbi:anaerobic sulfatase maturase [Candidatus Poribacteria bacterium]|nr:anaerobic sulfatase maturase [Candidatus Poribacteria bacterium]